MTGTSEDDRGERSRRYPATTVLDAVGLVELIHRGVGMGGGLRDTLAQAIGHSSLNGASKRKLASLIQYGLLDRDGERYRVSELARRALIPVTAREKEEAIAEAVRRPALFQQIGMAFDQQPIPSMLANVLARQYGILPAASTEVAALFVKSVEQAGLVVNGILDWAGTQQPTAAPEDANASEPPTTAATHATERFVTWPLRNSGPHQEYSIPLDNRGRKATIQLPTPVESVDLDRLDGWLKYMRTMVVTSADQADD